MLVQASNSNVAGNGRPGEIPLIEVTKLILESGLHSDMTLKCKGREFKVHKCFVCSQSKPLAAAMNGRFEESRTGVINLEDDEPEIVEKMVQFLYKAEYTPTCSMEAILNATASHSEIAVDEKTPRNILAESTDRALQSAVDIYVIGDKYDVPGLNAFAKSDFLGLLIMGTMTMDGFATVLSTIYYRLPASDDGLKNIVLEWLGKEKNLDKALESAVFKSICEEDGEVSFDIFKRVREFQVKSGNKEYSRMAGEVGRGFLVEKT